LLIERVRVTMIIPDIMVVAYVIVIIDWYGSNVLLTIRKGKILLISPFTE